VIREVTPEEAAEILRDNANAVYLDVRSEAEFAAGHPDGAYNVPIFFFDAAHRPSPNPDFVDVVAATFAKRKTLLLGCQSGMRSMRAAEILAERGWLDVANVAGGFAGSPFARGWRDSRLPVASGARGGRSYAELANKR
jgi:rhodanese-related sulfurtransferase